MSDNLFAIFNEALDEFAARESQSVFRRTSERHLCGRLSIYLERAQLAHGLVGYYADVEYNRKQGGRVKTILDHDAKVVVINADLILHSRGEKQRDNLIAIEMKKHDRPAAEKDADRMRLRAMTKPPQEVHSYDQYVPPEHVCGYELGIYMEIGKHGQCKIEEYRHGEFRAEYGYLFSETQPALVGASTLGLHRIR